MGQAACFERRVLRGVASRQITPFGESAKLLAGFAVYVYREAARFRFAIFAFSIGRAAPPIEHGQHNRLRVASA
jgi:hypothetical protein